MKQSFIRRFIITEETCTIGVPSMSYNLYSCRVVGKGQDGSKCRHLVQTANRFTVTGCVDNGNRPAQQALNYAYYILITTTCRLYLRVCMNVAVLLKHEFILVPHRMHVWGGTVHMYMYIHVLKQYMFNNYNNGRSLCSLVLHIKGFLISLLLLL